MFITASYWALLRPITLLLNGNPETIVTVVSEVTIAIYLIKVTNVTMLTWESNPGL